MFAAMRSYLADEGAHASERFNPDHFHSGIVSPDNCDFNSNRTLTSARAKRSGIGTISHVTTCSSAHGSAGDRLRRFQGVILDLEKMKSRIGARRPRAPNAEYATSIQEEANENAENTNAYLGGSCCDRTRDHGGVRAI
jgi:hypothetical protein